MPSPAHVPSHVPTPAPESVTVQQQNAPFNGYHLGIPASAQGLSPISPGTNGATHLVAGPSTSRSQSRGPTVHNISKHLTSHSATPDLTNSFNSPAGPNTGPHTPHVETGSNIAQAVRSNQQPQQVPHIDMDPLAYDELKFMMGSELWQVPDMSEFDDLSQYVNDHPIAEDSQS